MEMQLKRRVAILDHRHASDMSKVIVPHKKLTCHILMVEVSAGAVGNASTIKFDFVQRARCDLRMVFRADQFGRGRSRTPIFRAIMDSSCRCRGDN